MTWMQMVGDIVKSRDYNANGNRSIESIRIKWKVIGGHMVDIDINDYDAIISQVEGLRCQWWQDQLSSNEGVIGGHQC